MDKEKIKLKAEAYYKELKSLASKIVNLDNVTNTDFERLEFLLKIGGINDNNIKSLYENCGFKSWDEYLSSKKYSMPEQYGAISCVDDKIWIFVRNIELATRQSVYC